MYFKIFIGIVHDNKYKFNVLCHFVTAFVIGNKVLCLTKLLIDWLVTVSEQDFM